MDIIKLLEIISPIVGVSSLLVVTYYHLRDTIRVNAYQDIYLNFKWLGMTFVINSEKKLKQVTLWVMFTIILMVASLGILIHFINSYLFVARLVLIIIMSAGMYFNVKALYSLYHLSKKQSGNK